MSRPDDPRLLRFLLSHRLLVLSNTLALAASRHYAKRFAVRLAEWRVRVGVIAGGGSSAQQISPWLRTDKAWVGRSVERLIAAGYVRRRPDPTHALRLRRRLTPKRQHTYAAIAAAAQRRNDNVLAALSVREREALERSLGKLQERAAAM